MSLHKSILATLVYFDLFDRPLSAYEIRLFLCLPVSKAELQLGLLQLQSQSLVFRYYERYTLRDDHAFVERYNQCCPEQKLSNNYLLSLAKNISPLPFVTGIGYLPASGFVAGDNIDKGYLLIIVKPLYSCTVRCFIRVLEALRFIKKDASNRIEIIEEGEQLPFQNIINATRLFSIQPIFGMQCLKDLIKTNSWAQTFFPNNNLQVAKAKNIPQNYLKRFLEEAISCSIKMFSHRERGNSFSGKSIFTDDLFQQKLLAEYHLRCAAVWKRYRSAIKPLNKRLN